jgi:hypothetical protein
MATAAQRQALLAIPCPHCSASVGEMCGVARVTPRDGEGGKRRERSRPLTTLDGGCHDARWQAAGLGAARVLTEALAEAQQRPVSAVAAPQAAELVTVGERPW